MTDDPPDDREKIVYVWGGVVGHKPPQAYCYYEIFDPITSKKTLRFSTGAAERIVLEVREAVQQGYKIVLGEDQCGHSHPLNGSAEFFLPLMREGVLEGEVSEKRELIGANA
jgi:hypothetical protein